MFLTFYICVILLAWKEMNDNYILSQLFYLLQKKMKNLKYIILAIIITLVSIGNLNNFSYAQTQLESKIHNAIRKFAKKYDKTYVQKTFPKLIKILKSKKNTKNRIIINYIIKELENYLKYIKNYSDQKNALTRKAVSRSDIFEWKNTNQDSNTNSNFYKNINLSKLRQQRLIWLNQVRTQKWLPKLSLDDRLNYSATQRAQTLLERYHNWPKNINRNNVHKRNLSDKYYDYWKIANWMKQHWIVAKNINWITFTENVWYWFIKCPKQWDCTQAAINGTKTSFENLYIKEQKYNWVHYRWLTKPQFKKVGIWLRIDDKWYYRIVLHYATELE